MLIVKRIIPNSKRLAYCISTSAASRCDEPPKESPIKGDALKEDKQREKKRKKFEQFEERIVSTKEKETAKSILSTLSEMMSVEEEKKEEEEKDEIIDLRDLLKVQIARKEARQQRKKSFKEHLDVAAETVAAGLGGDIKKTKEDLLDHLRTIEVKKKEKEIQREHVPVANSGPKMDTETTLKVLEKVFYSTRLNIFHKRDAGTTNTEVKLNIWDKLEEEELAHMLKKPPRNQLEEWILWTEEGKLWKFPIDNDQGMEREAEVDFTQHVFLEEHLEGWCPKKGPLKKFMDLVLVGLSKNPYLTVEDKKEHIFWYRDYFEKKKKLLQELGALGSGKEIGGPATPP